MKEAQPINGASVEAADYFAQYTVPLGVKSRGSSLPWDKMPRGTFSLIDAGDCRVAVTCFHVVESLNRAREVEGDAELVGYVSFAQGLIELFGYKLIDGDPNLDIAIFIGNGDSLEIPGRRFIDFQGCYCGDVSQGEPILIVGYPGAGASVTPVLADFGYMHLLLPVSSVSDHRLVLANEQGTREFEYFDDPHKKEIDLGGLSGSPAFVLRNGRYYFAGIVTDCSERDQTILVSRLGCLDRNGTLNRSLLPP